MRSIELAKADGLMIDYTSAGRPYAYRGPRFAPDHGEEVLTELEATLLKLIGSLSDYMCGGYYEPRNEEEARIGALLFSIAKEYKV